MLKEFNTITKLSYEGRRRIKDKTDTYGGSISGALQKAYDIVTNWKKEWDENGTKPDPTESNNARKTLNSLKPIVEETRKSQGKILDILLKECNIGIEFDEKTRLALGCLLSINLFEPKGSNTTPRELAIDIYNGLSENGCVSLGIFSCPEISTEFLTTSKPDSYIRTEAIRTTATANPKPIVWITDVLNALEIPLELKIIVGEKDEESYIFPVTGNFGVNTSQLNQRREKYRSDFKNLCTRVFPKTPFDVIGWSEIENILPKSNINILETQDIKEEARRISSFFDSGGYYYGLPKPDMNGLLNIAKLKMREYSKQGLVIKQLYPNLILLQNEVPPLLRTRMLNASLYQPINAVYPFSTRESIY